MSADRNYEYRIANEVIYDESQDLEEYDYQDIHEQDYTEQFKILKKKRVADPKKNYIKNEENKKILFSLIKDEEIIWNSKHKLHQNPNALNAAWNRVHNMSSMSVDQCKSMWNDIRRAIRRRRKVPVKRTFDEIEYEDLTEVEENNVKNIMSFGTLSNSSSSKLQTKKILEDETNDEDGIEPENKQLNLETKKYKIKNDKLKLVEVIRKEEIIWNTKNRSHSNALVVAWNRVAKEMHPMTVEQCKTMWKSLKDALRYRKKLIAKERSDENDQEYYIEEGNVIEDILSLVSFDSTEKAQNTFEDNETNLSKFASSFSNVSDQNEIPVIYVESGDENFSMDNEDENDIFIKTVTRSRKLCKKAKKIKTSIDCEPRRYKIRNEKEKRLFVECMKKEECIWDLQHEYHGEPSFVDESWDRIANQMSMTVDQCKVMWKSIKDALRYRRKRAPLDGEKNFEREDDNLFDQINLLFPAYTNEINKNNSVTDKDDDKNEPRPHSNLSKISQKDEPNEILQSLGSISKAISELVTIGIKKQAHQSIAPFKYEYVWRLIENLYLQMNETTINEINQQIINLVYKFSKMKG